MRKLPKERLKKESSNVSDTTTEINSNDHRSVAEHLIMQSAEAPVEQTSDEPVVEETMADDQSDQSDEIIEDEATEPEAEAEPERMYTVKVDGEFREVTEQQLTQSFSGQQKIQQRSGAFWLV